MEQRRLHRNCEIIHILRSKTDRREQSPSHHHPRNHVTSSNNFRSFVECRKPAAMLVEHIIRQMRRLKPVTLPKLCSTRCPDISPYIYVPPECCSSHYDIFRRDIKLLPDFVTEDEESSLLEEVENDLRHRRYEFDHWDDAIHGFREKERDCWNAKNTKVIRRMRAEAFPPGSELLNAVHVLDLAENGWIKPHVDSVRFCGNIIAGLSLGTDSVMRFTLEGDATAKCDVLLKRRSLYIMKDEARYKFKHEILKNEESKFKSTVVFKGRRISLICRSEKLSNSE